VDFIKGLFEAQHKDIKRLSKKVICTDKEQDELKAKRTVSTSKLYSAEDIISELNEREARELYKINLLKAKYVSLVMPIIKKYWDIKQTEGEVKIIRVKSLQKLAIKTFNLNETVKSNILLPNFIAVNSKLLLEELFTVIGVKLKEGGAGRPEDFISYITSDTLLNNLDEEVLKLYQKVKLTTPEHIKQEFVNFIVINHPTLKFVNGKIVKANKVLSVKESELIIEVLKTKFKGRTDINSLIDYLYKDLKIISQRKARTGINWLAESEGKLTTEKIGRTSYYIVR
jgi:hypothetical protein